MPREDDGPGGQAVGPACPLRCRSRHGAAGDGPFGGQTSIREEVDWAGFPIDLDLAFSAQKRDKVYAQHLMLKRGAQLRRWLDDGVQACVCETTDDRGGLSIAVEFLSSQ
jgi:hypothetical protein